MLLSSSWHLFLSLLKTRCYLFGTMLGTLRILAKVSSLPFMDDISRITVPCSAHLISTYKFLLPYLKYWKGIHPHSNPVISIWLPAHLQPWLHTFLERNLEHFFTIPSAYASQEIHYKVGLSGSSYLALVRERP